jgi:hypothetical protein
MRPTKLFGSSVNGCSATGSSLLFPGQSFALCLQAAPLSTSLPFHERIKVPARPHRHGDHRPSLRAFSDYFLTKEFSRFLASTTLYSVPAIGSSLC